MRPFFALLTIATLSSSAFAFVPERAELPDVAAAHQADAGFAIGEGPDGITMEDIKAVADVEQDVKKAADAAKSGSFFLAFLAILLGVVKVLRGPGVKALALVGRLVPGKFGGFLTSAAAWLKTSRGGWALNATVAVIGGVTPLATGALPASLLNVVMMLGSSAITALAAGGAVEAKKDFSGPQAAGLAAAKSPASVLGA